MKNPHVWVLLIHITNDTLHIVIWSHQEKSLSISISIKCYLSNSNKCWTQLWKEKLAEECQFTKFTKVLFHIVLLDGFATVSLILF